MYGTALSERECFRVESVASALRYRWGRWLRVERDGSKRS